jgi:CheY-like chemotaxis protein
MDQPSASEAIATRRRILFVDDDAQFLQMIERVMRLWSKDRWEILVAETASAALAILQDQPVNLVVIDVCMPVVDGLQFLSILHRRYPDLQKVVLTGHASDAYRTACLSNGAELFLEKPRTPEATESIFATFDELTRWKPEPGFRGVLRRVGLMDVIQLECLNRSSSTLAVSAGNIGGAIYIREGEIVHAETGELKGEDAFHKLLSLASGDFRLNPYSDPPEITIHTKPESLLMDSAQRRDESGEIQVAPVELPSEPFLPPEAPNLSTQVQELLISSTAGAVLHAWQCSHTDQRISLLEFISQKIGPLQNALPLGQFDRLEFAAEAARLIAQLGPEHGLILRTSTASAENGATPAALRMADLIGSTAGKRRAQEWFRAKLDLPGFLAAALQLPDRSGLTHSLSAHFTSSGLENLRRSVSDAFQVAAMQRFDANRARWIFDQTVLECGRWPDGTCIALVLSRQTFDLDHHPAEQRLRDFLGMFHEAN